MKDKSEKEIPRIIKFFIFFNRIGLLYIIFLSCIVYEVFFVPKLNYGLFNYFFHITFALGVIGLYFKFLFNEK